MFIMFDLLQHVASMLKILHRFHHFHDFRNSSPFYTPVDRWSKSDGNYEDRDIEMISQNAYLMGLVKST